MRLAWVLGSAFAQDLFVKEKNFLAQRGLALQAVDRNATSLTAQLGHDQWVFQITLMSSLMLCVTVWDDVAGGGNGNPVGLSDCSGAEEQLWFFDGGTFNINWAGNSGMCLDAAGGMASGNTVQLWECLGNDGQMWGFDDQSGTIFMQNSASDASLCLDAQGGALQAGTSLELWECNSLDGQSFALQAGITIRASGLDTTGHPLCLDLPGGDTTNGVEVQMWECVGAWGQYWNFENDGGPIRLAGDTSKCLDAGTPMTEGQKLMIWDCDGLSSQNFGYDANMGTLYLSDSTQSDASLCVDIWGGEAKDGGQLDTFSCNGCWNQMFQAWGPSSSVLKSKGDGKGMFRPLSDAQCPDVPGSGSSNIFPADFCQYDTGVWPKFDTQQDLENDQWWSAYFTDVYGGIPTWGYPICPGAFQFLWQTAAKNAGVVTFDPIDCAPDADPNFKGEGRELDEGAYYMNNAFLDAQQAFGFIYNSNLKGASVPAGYFVEVGHTVFSGDEGAIWYYMAVGSGVWYNVGNTVVYTDHIDGVHDLLGSTVNCADQVQDTWGNTPTECEDNFEDSNLGTGMYTAALARGYESIQFTHHFDCTCGPEGESSYKYDRWCPTEIVALQDPNGAKYACSKLLSGGWGASSNCNCNEQFSSSTKNHGLSAGYANCGVN